MYNLNRVRLSCCWVGVGLGCDNNSYLGSAVKLKVSWQIMVSHHHQLRGQLLRDQATWHNKDINS